MSKQNMWAVFGMSKEKEQQGVVFEYPGNIRVTLARAGGSNDAFGKAYEKYMRPHRKMFAAGMLSEEINRSIVVNTYLDSIILKFETNLSEDENDPDWQECIIWPDDEMTPADKSNLLKLLTALPDLFTQIVSDAGDVASFRKEQIESDVKN